MDQQFEEYRTYNIKNQRESDFDYFKGLNNYFDEGIGTNLDKLRAFTKYVPLTEIGRFLAREKIFRKILGVQGSIVECGVHMGGGLMTWAALSSIYEPINHLRKIIGFDTFEGFPGLDENDQSESNENLSIGGLKVSSLDDINNAIDLYDSFRPLGHLQKVHLVKGDANDTIPEFIKHNKHLVVALLYLDFDIYKPTKGAIECFLERMPKGAVLAFDELNHQDWPGETQALLEVVGIRNLRIKRFGFQPQISYAVLE